MSEHSNIETADRWFRGEAKQLRYLIVDAVGEPLDCTGFALKWVLERPQSGEGDVLMKETGAGGGITIGDGNGTGDAVTVAIEAGDTDELADGVYRKALWCTDTGQEALLSEGDAHLQAAAEVDDEAP